MQRVLFKTQSPQFQDCGLCSWSGQRDANLEAILTIRNFFFLRDFAVVVVINLANANQRHPNSVMSERHSPLVSAAELEALIANLGASTDAVVDRWTPWRFWYLACIVSCYVVWLLLWPQLVAQNLSSDALEIVRLERFLYFRGWFLLIVLGLGLYAYLRAWYTAIVFSAYLVLGAVNLLFDLFTVYPEMLANPTPAFTVLMALRLLALWSVFLTVRNASRLPAVKDRANILLPFRSTNDTR